MSSKPAGSQKSIAAEINFGLRKSRELVAKYNAALLKSSTKTKRSVTSGQDSRKSG